MRLDNPTPPYAIILTDLRASLGLGLVTIVVGSTIICSGDTTSGHSRVLSSTAIVGSAAQDRILGSRTTQTVAVGLKHLVVEVWDRRRARSVALEGNGSREAVGRKHLAVGSCGRSLAAALSWVDGWTRGGNAVGRKHLTVQTLDGRWVRSVALQGDRALGLLDGATRERNAVSGEHFAVEVAGRGLHGVVGREHLCVHLLDTDLWVFVISIDIARHERASVARADWSNHSFFMLGQLTFLAAPSGLDGASRWSFGVAMILALLGRSELRGRKVSVVDGTKKEGPQRGKVDL